MKVQVDAPYYDGHIVFDTDNIESVYYGTNGGMIFYLKGGSRFRCVQNNKSISIAYDAGFSR